MARSEDKKLNRVVRPVAVLSVFVAFTVLAPGSFAEKKKGADELSFDGLALTEQTKTTLIYEKADVDYKQYDKLMILPSEVAFRKDWQRDHNRVLAMGASAAKVSKSDMAKILKTVADPFDEIFAEELGENGGHPIVAEAGEDVLLLRPAILNLDVKAPVLDPAVRTKVLSAGEGTLVLKAYDSVSMEILARVIDRQADPDKGFHTWATRAFNQVAAERIMKKWAVAMREGLDEARSE